METSKAPSAATSTALAPGGGSPALDSSTASTSRSSSSRRSCAVASATSSASAPPSMATWIPRVANRSSMLIPASAGQIRRLRCNDHIETDRREELACAPPRGCLVKCHRRADGEQSVSAPGHCTLAARGVLHGYGFEHLGDVLPRNRLKIAPVK